MGWFVAQQRRHQQSGRGAQTYGMKRRATVRVQVILVLVVILITTNDAPQRRPCVCWRSGATSKAEEASRPEVGIHSRAG